jgi:hypothetical protein
MDLVRGPELPTQWVYKGRVFFQTTTQHHYRFETKPFAQGDAAKPQWVPINDDPEIESSRRYAVFDKLPEDVQQRVIVFQWHPELGEPGSFARELTFVAPILALPKPAPPKSKAEKAKDAAEAAAALASQTFEAPLGLPPGSVVTITPGGAV